MVVRRPRKRSAGVASRQDPLTTREGSTNVLQPAILQNGPVGLWLTRLSDDHGVTNLATLREVGR